MAELRKTLNAPAYPGETDGQAKARTILRPTVHAACTLQLIEPDLAKEVPLTDLVDALADQVRAVKGGDLTRPEAMLVAQAHTLDQLFNRLARQAAANVGHYPDTVALYMKLALKAQAQCARTVEVLNEIKNPRQLAFVAQANVGQNVQVNNSAANYAQAHAGAEKQNAPTELLQASDGEYLDVGTAGAAVRGDKALATVGLQHRAAHA